MMRKDDELSKIETEKTETGQEKNKKETSVRKQKKKHMTEKIRLYEE